MNPSIATATGATPATTNWRPWIIARDHFDAAYNAVATYVADKKFDAVVTYFANKPDQLYNAYWRFAVAISDAYGIHGSFNDYLAYFNSLSYNTRYAFVSSYMKPIYNNDYGTVERVYEKSSGLSLNKVVQTNIQLERTSTKVKTLFTNLQNAGVELANLNAIEAKMAAKYIPNLLPRWYQAVYFIGADDLKDMQYIAKFRANAGV
jgi:hypothetical protein